MTSFGPALRSALEPPTPVLQAVAPMLQPVALPLQEAAPVLVPPPFQPLPPSLPAPAPPLHPISVPLQALAPPRQAPIVAMVMPVARLPGAVAGMVAVEPFALDREGIERTDLGGQQWRRETEGGGEGE